MYRYACLRQDVAEKLEQKYDSHRDRVEIKRDKVLEAKRSKAISNVNNQTKPVLEDPRLWTVHNLLI